MSYTPPRQWHHGDTPTAADMNIYSAGLTLLGALIRSLNWATPYSTMDDTQQVWLVHSKRYLHYVSTGEIIDPAGVGEAVSLSSPNAVDTYDLDEITWLLPGKLYQIVGCSCAFEDNLPS